ncbi:MAG: hypothetical protein RB288_00190 [Bacteroidales bacterium]|jgi:hypothetical protein|nr:hypothetical protein [Bacteroidales bacterium]
MIKSEKKLAELRRILSNGKYNEINDRISMLRAEEPFEGAIMLLARFYDETDREEIKSAIAAFFNDMKERSGRPEVIGSLDSVKKPETKAMLASSCWQSGLDYSEYAVELGEAFMWGDYMTSLECFTVLENCSETISADHKAGIIARLDSTMTQYDTPLQKLAAELMAILKQ